jgi:hypothetical protein
MSDMMPYLLALVALVSVIALVMSWLCWWCSPTTEELDARIKAVLADRVGDVVMQQLRDHRSRGFAAVKAARMVALVPRDEEER